MQKYFSCDFKRSGYSYSLSEMQHKSMRKDFSLITYLSFYQKESGNWEEKQKEHRVGKLN